MCLRVAAPTTKQGGDAVDSTPPERFPACAARPKPPPGLPCGAGLRHWLRPSAGIERRDSFEDCGPIFDGPVLSHSHALCTPSRLARILLDDSASRALGLTMGYLGQALPFALIFLRDFLDLPSIARLPRAARASLFSATLDFKQPLHQLDKVFHNFLQGWQGRWADIVGVAKAENWSKANSFRTGADLKTVSPLASVSHSLKNHGHPVRVRHVGKLGPAKGTHKRLVFPSSSSRIRQWNHDSRASLFSGGVCSGFMLGAPGSNVGSVISRVARSSTKERERLLAQVRDRPARRRLFRCLCIPGAAAQSECWQVLGRRRRQREGAGGFAV